jgi:hypothetical protein
MTCCKERGAHDFMEITPLSGPTVGTCTLDFNVDPVLPIKLGLSEYGQFTIVW